MLKMQFDIAVYKCDYFEYLVEIDTCVYVRKGPLILDIKIIYILEYTLSLIYFYSILSLHFVQLPSVTVRIGNELHVEAEQDRETSSLD